MADCALKLIVDGKATFGKRFGQLHLLLFFSGNFAPLIWLTKRGLMMGIIFSNELISRDKVC
jgi:ribonucleotide reductase beta subunit family protein with ferritin-like domain